MARMTRLIKQVPDRPEFRVIRAIRGLPYQILIECRFE